MEFRKMVMITKENIFRTFEDFKNKTHEVWIMQGKFATLNYIKAAKFSMMKDGISNIGKQAIALEKIFKGEIITIQNV